MKRILRTILIDRFDRTLLRVALSASVWACVACFSGCETTSEQRAMNVDAKRRAIEVNEAIQADPGASPKVKNQAAKLVAVASAGVDAQGGFDVVGLATSLGGLLPPPWNLIPALAVPVLVGLVQQRRLNAAKAASATPAKETP